MTTTNRVIRFIERHCVHADGAWIGQPLRLLSWQRALLLDLFAVDAGSGLRRYREAYIQVPKKQGKTTLAAAIALYLLLADGEPSPLVVCAASSEDQADLVFGYAKRMCQLSPTLRALTECYDREILVPSAPGARLRRVAAVAGANDGMNIHGVVCDELHEWTGERGEGVHTVLTNGTAARRQPLILQITTAGFDHDTVCYRKYQYAKRALADPSVDPTFYTYLREAPADCDHRDPAVWEAVNPSFGVTVGREFYEGELRKKPESVFRRYYLNQWVTTERYWLPPGVWEAARSEAQLDPSRPLIIAVDVALRHDSTAVVWLQKRDDGTMVVRARVWSNPHAVDSEAYHQYATPLGEVRALIAELAAAYRAPAVTRDGKPAPGPVALYDPRFFAESAQMLEAAGVTMIEFPQSDSRMIPAILATYEAIMARRVLHDGDSVLAQHLRNVQPKESDRGVRLYKRTRHHRIDAAISLVMAVGFAATWQPPREEPSVYRTRGVVTL